MTALYISSLSDNAGKTMLSAGLGKSLVAEGKKIGYIKPIISEVKAEGSNNQKDAAFIKQVLALKESIEDISPVINVAGDTVSVSGIKQAYVRAAQGRDVMIIEGLPLTMSGPVVEALDARVLILHDYSNQLAESVNEYKKMGKYLAGIVINKVPERRLAFARSEASNLISLTGPLVLGIIPEDRVLMSLTVAELAGALQGKILNNTENSYDLIENIMLGAMTVDSGVEYFGRKNNKAVILKGDRPDMQMAALQTSTRCMVLSEGSQPLPVVARQAVLKKIPVISAQGDVPFLVSIVEKAMVGSKFNQDKKMPRLMEVIRQNVNLKQLAQELGLAG